MELKDRNYDNIHRNNHGNILRRLLLYKRGVTDAIGNVHCPACDKAEASLKATKGVVTRLSKRASAGTCPCCNRTFKQLAAHMATKHQTFTAVGGLTTR